VRAALGLSQVDEALYLQRQQEIQRDFQIRQMLLAEQLDQQTRLDSMLHEQQLKAIGDHLQEFPDLQQHYSRILMNEQYQRHEERSLFRERQIQQEEIRRRTLVQNQAQHQQAQSSSTKVQDGTLNDILGDSLADNAMKKGELEKRVFVNPDIECVIGTKKRVRSDTNESLDSKVKRKNEMKSPRKDEASLSSQETAKPAAVEEDTRKPAAMLLNISSDDHSAKVSAQTLLGFATTPSKQPLNFPQSIAAMMPNRSAVLPMPRQSLHPHIPMPINAYSFPVGTISDLLAAATSENKSDEAIATLQKIKSHVEWSDSESEREEDFDLERKIARAKGDVIQLPGFTSILPQLPQEPTVFIMEENRIGKEKKKKKKHKGLLDDDSIDNTTKGKSYKSSRKDSRAIENGEKSKFDDSSQDFPYPIDTWWPSATSIRRERKLVGEYGSDDRGDKDDEVFGKDAAFHANVEKLRRKLLNEVTPGVLEKVHHCRVHRQCMQKRKNSSAPEFVHCFQVTELYPNEVMVCCSVCGVWRHASCGGHHKPYSVREAINAPFVAVCDRCHEEEKILRDYPLGRKRLDRQRTEQIRRGLATSATMRQASFSKHGGTYKWPLGSVSATHIGGHTRSVHSRHDKAEKQWMDMATRLGRGYGYRPKERIKFRTKELERLLVSVEDAGKNICSCHAILPFRNFRISNSLFCLLAIEGHMDRHNMMLFLLQDTLRKDPVGFEKRRRNLFDPEEDMPSDALMNESDQSASRDVRDDSIRGDTMSEGEGDDDDKKKNTTCSRAGCGKKPQFDSLFCSDSCGVSALESDLLRTFQYASDIHPSLLRN
jgi:hypothetical protein